jgi:hypothetical protein
LGSDLLGVNVARPEAENETESDLPIIE